MLLNYMHVHSSAYKQGVSRFYIRTPATASAAPHMVLLWMVVENDTEEKELLIKVVIFVFFVHKKYSRIFIKLRLNHWCHMGYFNNVLTMFLGLNVVIILQGQKALGFHKNILICVIKMNHFCVNYPFIPWLMGSLLLFLCS